MPERSPRELAGAILAILGDAGRLQRFSAQAAASVEAHFGAARQIEALEDCYEAAMKPG